MKPCQLRGMADWSVCSKRKETVGRNERRMNVACDAQASWSEGGSPSRNPEGDVGDLCITHKGLAHVFEVRRRISSKGVKCLECRNGMKGMNTLDSYE
jgi:hypothetical protein